MRVDDVLGDVTRLLAVSDGQLAASGVPGTGFSFNLAYCD